MYEGIIQALNSIARALRPEDRITALEAYDAALSSAWTTWTPSWTNLTVGNGTLSAAYKQIGKTVHFSLFLTFGNTTSVAGNVSLAAPINNKRDTPAQGLYGDSGVNTLVGCPIVSGNVIYIRCENSSGTYGTASANMSATVPFTWTTNDALVISGTYEAA
jgi:hypothetical protein